MKKYTLHSILLVFAFVLAVPAFVQAQKQAPDPDRFTSAELKKIEKSQKLNGKRKYDKAITLLAGVQETHLLSNQLWSLRVQYEVNRFYSKSNTSEGTELKGKFLAQCMLATLYCKDQEMASLYLRTYIVDKNVDEGVSKDAKEEFQLGESAFFNGDYENAEKHYKRACSEDSTYYKATLYVGDAFYRDKEYDQALVWYGKAVNMHPELLEGRKYLTDVYRKLHRYKEAYDACVDAIIVYPDVGMFIKLNDICDEMDKKFDQHWMPRFYFPNNMAIDQQPVENEPWSFYREAKNKVADKCSKDGIIDGKEGSMQYLEVYSWNEMLTKGKDTDEDLIFASEAKKGGFLDCYVFVSLFHNSMYKQYKVFAKNNADRIRQYIATYLVK